MCRKISRISNQFQKFVFWPIPPKHPFRSTISRKKCQKASRCKYFKASIYNSDEHTSRVFNRRPPLSFEITKHELVFDVRPGFVEITVIPSTQ